MRTIMIAALVALLAACGGDSSDHVGEAGTESYSGLIYSYPDNGQEQVPVSAPVVLRFSSPMSGTIEELAELVTVTDEEQTPVSWASVEKVDDSKSLILYPEQDLTPMMRFQVQLDEIELKEGTSEPRTLSFSTRALREGPKSLVAEDEFRVIRTIPDGQNFEVQEFSTFRVQFSQPLQRSSVVYGEGPEATVSLTGPGGLVDAHMIAHGPFLTIDPKEDLVADQGYTLTFTTDLTSEYGDTLPPAFGTSNGVAVNISVTPNATGPRSTMLQNIPSTEGQPSPLTGRQINQVPVVSTLLGKDSATQAHGELNAELGFVPSFPSAVPLRVERGSVIEGDSIPVKLGGMIFLYDTGTIRLHFISDATGYLLPNPYSDDPDAPRQVRLWLDTAITAENPQANGAITQDLMHIELVGISRVKNDHMTIDAVGVAEPLLQGAEWASSLLSFHMVEKIPEETVPPEEE